MGKQQVLQQFQDQRNQEYKRAQEDLKLQIMEEEAREERAQELWKQHQARSFKPKVLEAAQERLLKMADPAWCEKRRSGWEKAQFFPHIGARARKGQKMSHQSSKFDPLLFELTTSGVDRALWLAQAGDHESLGQLVCDPDAFQLNAEETAIVGKDETPVWLKLRGEEEQFLAQSEIQARNTRRRLSRKTQDSDAGVAQAALQDLIRFAEEHPDLTMQVNQQWSQGGDKYRLTVITFQVIRHWLKPGTKPVGETIKPILLVPCQYHCQLSNIDPATGTWIQTVQQETRKTQLLAAMFY